ncbi:MAG TPA: hypothetical protein VM691_08320, partial [Myxococcales bacterium]|nr:hypothetical protein [Myxococcales bacterium]
PIEESELFPEMDESELFAEIDESELFPEIDESELFAALELSELGMVAVLDELDFWSSFVRCASLVAESFCELPRFTCANAGAAPSASAARIAILMLPPVMGAFPPGEGPLGERS